MPVVTTLILALAPVLAFLPVVSERSSHLLLVQAGRALGHDPSLTLLLLAAWFLDIATVGVIATWIYGEISETGEKLVFSPQLLTVERK